MTIIDKIVSPAPRFLYSKWLKTCPDLTTCSTYDKDKFYDREMERWLHGWGGLSNYHYFQLTQTKMKNADGLEIRPYWRDLDEEKFFQPYELAIKTCQDIMFVKRREAGLSGVFWGVVPLLNCIIYPGSVNLLTSADKERIKASFLEKTVITYDSLDEEIRPQNASSRLEGYLYFAKQDPKTKKYSGLKSSIVTKDTVDNPNAFETYRAKSVFLDEQFLHPKASKVRISAQACVRKGLSKIAPIALGGSVGVTSKDGAALGEKLWKDAEQLGIITVFVEGWKGIMEADEFDDNGKVIGKGTLNFCKNGHSDEKGATEWILKRRDWLSKANDKSELDAFVKEYPLTIDEVFTVQGGERWEEDVKEKIVLQRKKVLEADVPITRCNLINSNGNITYELSKKGNTHILEHPKQGCEYILGVDGIATGSEFGGTEGSDVAGTIIKIHEVGSDPYMPVCIYTERPKTVEASYIRLVSQALYYNKFGGLKTIAMEASVGTNDHFSTFLDKEGLLKYAMKRKDLSGKGWSDTSKIGQPRSIENVDFQYKQGNMFLRRWIASIQMLLLLDQMLLPASVNADILDSWLQIFNAIPDIGKPKVIQKPMARPKPQIITYSNGVSYRTNTEIWIK